MQRTWLLIGGVSYLFAAAILFPFVLGVPWEWVFGSDAIGYSRGAVNLLTQGFYSFDGVAAFTDREPGMSLFLVPIYFLFGIENGIAFSAVQAAMLFLSAWALCHQAGRRYGARAAGIAFVLILTSGSVLHTVFSAYRECLALSLLMLFSALFLSSERAFWKTVLMGLLLGFLILVQYSFVFFPPLLLIVYFWEKRGLQEPVLIILIAYAVVSLWAFRNFTHTGRFEVVDSRRIAVMWYVRGEQAEQVTGTEPFLCLWAEYISRDWAGRSSACSFNGLMHVRWPEAFDLSADYSDVLAEGKAKVREHFLSYLWFSLVDVIELHLPFVGGGWSTRYNVYAAFSAFLMYLGFTLGLPALMRREHVLWLLIIGYNTAIFVLTDATPRYLLPVIFCYALLAGIGYDRSLKRLRNIS